MKIWNKYFSFSLDRCANLTFSWSYPVKSYMIISNNNVRIAKKSSQNQILVLHHHHFHVFLCSHVLFSFLAWKIISNGCIHLLTRTMTFYLLLHAKEYSSEICFLCHVGSTFDIWTLLLYVLITTIPKCKLWLMKICIIFVPYFFSQLICIS